MNNTSYRWLQYFKKYLILDNKSGRIQQLPSRKKVKHKNKVSAEVKQHRLEQKRIAEKLRREKIQNDPKAYENYCRNERVRNEKRKKEGKLKSIQELSEREKRARRIQQNLWKKTHGHDKKENKKLSENNKKLRTTINSLHKKLQRLNIKKSDSTSPKFKVDKILNGQNVNPEVRITLIFHEVMVRQLKSSYQNSKSSKFKQILGRAISGKIVKKYRRLSAIRKNIVPIISSRVDRSNKPLEYVKNTKSNQKFIQDQVISFYEENSKMIPDKKASIKMNGKQVTKRYMNATIKDLHSQFCSQSTYRVIYSTFAKLRPKYCIEPKVNNRNTCACFTHENFSLLIQAFHSHKLLTENTSYKILSSCLCDSISELCLSRKCDKSINHFKHELDLFIAHKYRITYQNNSMKKLTQSLQSNELGLLIDFSENYSSTNPEINKLYIMGDGPTTQYRNIKMFYLITQYLPQCYTQLEDITYNFSEAGHGKSSADRISGYIKKLADDQVKYGLDVTNFDSLLAILRNRVKSVYIDCVTEDEISNIDSILPSNFKPFIGTMKIHQYTWNKLQHNCILFNSLSCFDCSNKSPCIHFAMGKIDYSVNDTAGKINKRLIAKIKKSENSSPKLTKNLKCLEKDVAKDILGKNETISLRRSARIKKTDENQKQYIN
ncbi:unnamed protein product [Psylliodes chrysocephalus]|uniref:Uncharacterized protein n=1 Tax=Psylliodes chrysocephalus TaxID=3402493 RepID=A0A9P0DB90_9CUCU|nr:unnamed protein product [Psylliodes chrysocephala]